MKNLNKIYLLIFMIFIGTFTSVNSQASTFSVSMNPSGDQIDSTYTYYYLKTDPGKTMTVSLNVENLSDDEITVQTGVKNAITNSSGQIVYSTNKDGLIESFKYPLTSLVKPEVDTVTIPKNESKDIKFTITPPPEHYSGIIAGALSIEDYVPEDSKGFKEVVGFDMGMNLSENGDDYRNGKNVLLDKVEATLNQRKRVILATIQNPDSVIVDIDTVNTKIINKQTGEVIKEQNYKGFSLAPNANVNLEYNWGVANLPSGTFIYKFEGSNSTDSWKLEKEFSISSKKAAEINEGSAFNVVTPTWVKIYAAINLIIVIIIITMLIIRRKKLETQMKIRRKKKKKKKNKKGGK